MWGEGRPGSAGTRAGFLLTGDIPGRHYQTAVPPHWQSLDVDVAKKYAIGRAPAFIIAKPNGEPVERYVGMPTLETFLDRVARGKARAVPATPTRAAPGKLE